MRPFAHRLQRLIQADTGATAVEYAVMLALILIAVLTGIATFGDATKACFEYSRDEINKVIK